MKSRFWSFSDEEFSKIVKESKTIVEISNKMGYKMKGGGITKFIKARIETLNLDTSHFNRYCNSSHPQKELSEILVKNSSYTNNRSLKKRLIDANLLKYECSVCGIKNWNGKDLVLQLDHINGNNKDNRLSNLRLLCPNCHSQTETFAGKNAKYNKEL